MCNKNLEEGKFCDKKCWRRRFTREKVAGRKRVLEVWGTYIQEMQNRENRPEIVEIEIEPETEVDEEEKGPCILRIDVERAIKDMKSQKATGDDDIRT